MQSKAFKFVLKHFICKICDKILQTQFGKKDESVRSHLIYIFPRTSDFEVAIPVIIYWIGFINFDWWHRVDRDLFSDLLKWHQFVTRLEKLVLTHDSNIVGGFGCICTQKLLLNCSSKKKNKKQKTSQTPYHTTKSHYSKYTTLHIQCIYGFQFVPLVSNSMWLWQI